LRGKQKELQPSRGNDARETLSLAGRNGSAYQSFACRPGRQNCSVVAFYFITDPNFFKICFQTQINILKGIVWDIENEWLGVKQ
jgi:hypothetical protein